jgi:heme-degrading monooxygenase HmoA
MAVLVLTEIPGATAEDGKQWEPVMGQLRRSPGFVFQADGPMEGGWRLVSVWEKREDFRHFYESAVKPNLPPGTPDRDRVYELANVLFAAGDGQS